MSTAELKNIAFKNTVIELADCTDRLFVKAMKILYIAYGNGIITKQEAAEITGDLEADYRVMKLHHDMYLNKIGTDIAQELNSEKEIDFSGYQLSIKDWEQVGKVINEKVGFSNE